MPVNVIQLIGALILIFFLPGFMLVQALFPRKNELHEEDDLLYRIVLAIGLSIAITTLVGCVLGLFINPLTGKGFYDKPYIIATLLGISGILFVVGWYRGAYPFLGRGAKYEIKVDIPDEKRKYLYELMDEWKTLKRRVKLYEEHARGEVPHVQRRYAARIARLNKRIEKLDREIKSLGKRRRSEEIAQELHEVVRQWKKVRDQIRECDKKIDKAPKPIKERYRARRRKLQLELEKLDAKISELREEEAE
jgi:phage host-nuclease inhibitor protein Gam